MGDVKKLKTLFAPLEGMTDGIFRRAHYDFFGGVEEYAIPFIRLTGDLALTGGERREISPGENAGIPCVPQVLTKEAEQLLWAAGMLRDLGYGTVDLNLGCPAPTVVTRGRGSAMLQDPAALRRFFDRVFPACPIRLSVKTRIGFSSPDEWEKLLDVLADYPLSRVVIHPRTREEQYSGPVHPEAFAAALERFGPRAVWNGDILTPADADRITRLFPGTDGVMIGRGLIRDPSLARRLSGGKSADLGEIKAFFDRLFGDYLERFGLPVALGRMKKLFLLLSEGMPEGKKMYKDIKKASSADRYLAASEKMLGSWRPADGDR